MKVFAVLLISFGVATAARDESVKVIDNLRALQPAYRDLSLFVVDAVAESKRNVADIINDFQTAVVTTKDRNLRSAITQEDNILQEIIQQNPSISVNCSFLVRDKVDNDMQLAGFRFSSCILAIDEELNKEISNVYVQLDENSGSPKNISIYEAFEGNNIFQNPEDINELLERKLFQLQSLPTSLPAKLQSYVDTFKSNLTPIIRQYDYCLNKNSELLAEAFAITLKQFNVICKEK